MNLWTWLRAEWDRVAGFGFVLLGALLLFLGYRGVHNSPFLAEELAYIASGGLGGLFCLGLGVGLLLSADLHDEWYKLDRIEAAMRGEPLPESTTVLDLMAEEGSSRKGPSAPPDTGSRHDASRSTQVTAAVALEPAPARRERPGGAIALAMEWRTTHRAPALAILALALCLPLALSTAGWHRASHTPDLNVATQGLAIAMAGTAIALAAIAGYTFWLRARVVRREGRLFREYMVTQGLASLRRTEPVPAATAGERNSRNGSAGDVVVVVPGLRRYHRTGCPTLAGLEVSTVARATLGDGHSPCGICGA